MAAKPVPLLEGPEPDDRGNASCPGPVERLERCVNLVAAASFGEWAGEDVTDAEGELPVE